MDPFKDEEGMILPGDFAAREHVMQIVNELQKGDEESWIGYVMEVMREGRVVCAGRQHRDERLVVFVQPARVMPAQHGDAMPVGERLGLAPPDGPG